MNMYDTDAPAKYENNTGLSARVGKLNPPWDEPTSAEIYMSGFHKAVALTGAEFVAATKYYGESWLKAREHVVSALDDAVKTHESGEILKLPCYCPWKEHLFELERERGTDPLPKYVLFQDDKGQWRIQAIPLTPTAFENRKPLPAAWRGVRDAALDEVTGIEGGGGGGGGYSCTPRGSSGGTRRSRARSPWPSRRSRWTETQTSERRETRDERRETPLSSVREDVRSDYGLVHHVYSG